MTDWRSLAPAERIVLDCIFWSAGLSRHELAAKVGFSKSRTNAATGSLIDRGLIEEAGPGCSTGGRRPETLSLSRQIGIFAAIDLGATSLDVALLAPDMSILAHHAEPADVRNGPGLIVSRIRTLMRELIKKGRANARDIVAIGMGVPGPVDFADGLLVAPPLMPGWEGFSIGEYLHEDYGAPVFIDNDVNLLAMGELWRVHREIRDFLVIKVGTGIGCGIVCRGEIYRGTDGSAGDVGHICVDYDGPRCHCGNDGCVEAMAAAPALSRLAVEAAREGRSTLLAEWLEARGALVPDDVSQASRAGDVAANAIIQRAGELLGRMLASLVNFYNPSHVFVAGGVSRIGPLYLASIRQSVYRRSLPLSTRHIHIEFAKLNEIGGIVGAGALAFQEFLKRTPA